MPDDSNLRLESAKKVLNLIRPELADFTAELDFSDALARQRDSGEDRWTCQDYLEFLVRESTLKLIEMDHRVDPHFHSDAAASFCGRELWSLFADLEVLNFRNLLERKSESDLFLKRLCSAALKISEVHDICSTLSLRGETLLDKAEGILAEKVEEKILRKKIQDQVSRESSLGNSFGLSAFFS